MSKLHSIIAIVAATTLLVAGCGAALIGGAVLKVVEAIPEPEPKPQGTIGGADGPPTNGKQPKILYKLIPLNSTFQIKEHEKVILSGGTIIELHDDNHDNGVIIFKSSSKGLEYYVDNHRGIQISRNSRLVCIKHNLPGEKATLAFGDNNFLSVQQPKKDKKEIKKQDRKMIDPAMSSITSKLQAAERDLRKLDITPKRLEALESTALAFNLLEDYLASEREDKQLEPEPVQKLRRKYFILHGLFAWRLHLHGKGEQWLKTTQDDFNHAVELDLLLRYKKDDAYSIAKDSWTATTKTMWTMQRKKHEKEQ